VTQLTSIDNIDYICYALDVKTLIAENESLIQYF